MMAAVIPYQTWAAKVIDYVDNNARAESHALLPLCFHFVMRYLPGSEPSRQRMHDAKGMPTLKLYQRQRRASTRELSAGTAGASYMRSGFLADASSC